MTFKKILIIIPAKLHEAISVTPAIRLLQQTFPRARIDALALGDLSSEVVRHHPAITHIRASDYLQHPELFSFYDVFINIFANAELEKKFSKIKVIGPFQGDTYLDSLATVLNVTNFSNNLPCELFPQSQHMHSVQALLFQAGVRSEDELIGIHVPVAQKIKKSLFSRWKKLPIQESVVQLTKLIEHLAANHPKYKIILMGEDATTHITNPALIDLRGQLSFLEMIALLKCLRLCFSVDEGIHYAAQASSVVFKSFTAPANEIEEVL